MSMVIKENSKNKISLVYFYILLIIAFFFSIHVSYNHPVSDAFYYIKHIIIPYHNNQFELRDLFTVRGQNDHMHFLYKLFLILNYKVFNLDFRIELITGLIGMYFSSLIIIRSLNENLNSRTLFMTVLTQIVIMSKLISFNEYEQFSWTLVTFQYLMILPGLLLFWYCNKIIINGNGSLWKLCSMMILTIIFGSSYGELSVLVSIFVLLIFGLIKKRRSFILIAVVFMVFLALAKISPILLLMDSKQKFYFNPIFSIGAIKFVLYLFSQGLLSVSNIKYLYNILNIDYHVGSLALGIFVLFLNLLVLFIYVKRKFYLITVYPLMLILFSYAINFSLTWIRFRYFGAEYAFQPRYVLLMEFNIVALLWISGLNCLRNAKKTFNFFTPALQ